MGLIQLHSYLPLTHTISYHFNRHDLPLYDGMITPTTHFYSILTFILPFKSHSHHPVKGYQTQIKNVI